VVERVNSLARQLGIGETLFWLPEPSVLWPAFALCGAQWRELRADNHQRASGGDARLAKTTLDNGGSVSSLGDLVVDGISEYLPGIPQQQNEWQSTPPVFPKLPKEQLLPLCKVGLGPLAFFPPRQPKAVVVVRCSHGPLILRQTFAENRKGAPGVVIVGYDQDGTWWRLQLL
jgi:hypothetical protein